MRKIKIGCLVVMFLLVTLASSFALRLGLEFGNPDAVIVIRINPIDLKIGYNFAGLMGGGTSVFFHISGDYRIIQMNLIDFLNLYIGAGAYAQVFTGGEGAFGFGARIPIGLNAYLAKNVIEVFVEAVPTISFLPAPGFGGIQGYLGFTIAVPKF